ncbi:hypothetical protein VTN77DRAFT_4928 [Rasamsonia byssochlamydoides]|uniref:uncharacterized protein n=1 Tax=Rasamsonia byssochlamydoides TaxID=89139 RepID=UPI003743C6BE
MRVVFLTLSALAALAAAADNPFLIPNGGYTFTVGKPTTLEWTPTTSGTVSLQLQWGAVTTPDQGITIASNIPNSGSFTWTPPSNLVSEPDFTIRIIDDADPSDANFLPRFTVAGAAATASVTGASSTATSAAASTTAASSSAASTTLITTTSPSSTASSSAVSSTPASSSTLSSSASSSTTTTTSTTTTSSAPTSTSASTTTSVPKLNGSPAMSLNVPGVLMGLVLGAMALM